MADFGPQVRKLLTESGWELRRQGKGDHQIWWDPKSGAKVTIDHKIKSRHTANGITKQAGLGKRF